MFSAFYRDLPMPYRPVVTSAALYLVGPHDRVNLTRLDELAEKARDVTPMQGAR